MIEVFKILLMSAVQGITEFLPVSSSGHLVLTKILLELEAPGIDLEVALHAGTLIAVLLYYRQRIAEMTSGLFQRNPADWRYVAYLLVSAIPAGVAYVLWDEPLEKLFDKPVYVGFALCITGITLLMLRLPHLRPASAAISLPVALIMGLAQAVALIPGISRSGSTLVTARLMGVMPRKAAEFSLLMSFIPIAGATVIKLIGRFMDASPGEISGIFLIAGMFASLVVGYAAIIILVRVLEAGRLWWFGPYCLAAGAIVIVLA